MLLEKKLEDHLRCPAATPDNPNHKQWHLAKLQGASKHSSILQHPPYKYIAEQPTERNSYSKPNLYYSSFLAASLPVWTMLEGTGNKHLYKSQHEKLPSSHLAFSRNTRNQIRYPILKPRPPLLI